MRRDYRLLFGAIAAVILAGAIVLLPILVPGYDSVRQTVSEIGEIGSPARVPFAVALCAVAACIITFACGLWGEARRSRRGYAAAALIAFMAVPVSGVGVFAFPHPLHNVFGMLELIGYQAPLAAAIAWSRDPERRSESRFSWVLFILVWISIVLNLASITRGPIWESVAPYYGLVQRSLFALWFGWAAVLGLMLWRHGSKSDR